MPRNPSPPPGPKPLASPAPPPRSGVTRLAWAPPHATPREIDRGTGVSCGPPEGPDAAAVARLLGWSLARLILIGAAVALACWLIS